MNSLTLSHVLNEAKWAFSAAQSMADDPIVLVLDSDFSSTTTFKHLPVAVNVGKK